MVTSTCNFNTWGVEADQKLNVILSCTMSSRPTWDTWEPVKKKKSQIKTTIRLPHSCHSADYHKGKRKGLVSMWRKRALKHWGGDVNQFSHCRKPGIFSKNYTVIYTTIQQFHVCISIRRKWNQCVGDICFPMFTAALFTTAKIWSQYKCRSLRNA